MNIFKSMTVIATLVIATGALGEDTSSVQMPSPYFDELNAKLIAAGYRDVRVVDESSHRMVAYDWNGSEVILIAHPTNRTILSSTFARPADS
jgi:hypothetical protein